MKHVRKIKKILQSKPTLEGAGVHLKRAFGYSEVPLLDPFLMLDHFGSANPRDYMAGFPWHPHRGIETVTYMIEGVVEHGDSIGNKGAINSGEIQWMTAGSGIVHQEMPQRCEGIMKGFQLWVNLPGSHKMMDPRYRGILASEIPEVALGKDIRVKVIAGDVNKVKGPVRDLVVECEYLDVTLGLHAAFDYPVKQGHRAFAYVFEGNGYFDPDKDKQVNEEHLVIYQDGDHVNITAADHPLRFLFVFGMPLGEPVAWRGPIVMNTQEELDLAFEEYRNGTFIKYKSK